MKREIMFKARKLDGSGWVYGCYINDLTVGHCIYQVLTDCGDSRTTPPADYDIHNQINPDTLCQFTGLDDKNGGRIFEGDILICKYGKHHNNKNGLTRRGVVEYDTNARFVFVVDNSMVRVSFIDAYEFELTSKNIHDKK